MRRRQIHSMISMSATIWAGVAAIALAAEPAAREDVGKLRGPLDVHAVWVRQIVDTLDLSDAQRAEVHKLIDEGHAAWRKWFEANHEEVAAHTHAVQEAKQSGDKARQTEAMKKKKAFMHTAPSIFRHSEPVRNALPDAIRATFDARLLSKIKEVHSPQPAGSVADGPGER